MAGFLYLGGPNAALPLAALKGTRYLRLSYSFSLDGTKVVSDVGGGPSQAARGPSGLNLKILFSIESPPQKAPPTVLKLGFPLRDHPPLCGDTGAQFLFRIIRPPAGGWTNLKLDRGNRSLADASGSERSWPSGSLTSMHSYGARSVRAREACLPRGEAHRMGSGSGTAVANGVEAIDLSQEGPS